MALGPKVPQVPGPVAQAICLVTQILGGHKTVVVQVCERALTTPPQTLEPVAVKKSLLGPQAPKLIVVVGILAVPPGASEAPLRTVTVLTLPLVLVMVSVTVTLTRGTLPQFETTPETV